MRRVRRVALILMRLSIEPAVPQTLCYASIPRNCYLYIRLNCSLPTFLRIDLRKRISFVLHFTHECFEGLEPIH